MSADKLLSSYCVINSFLFIHLQIIYVKIIFLLSSIKKSGFLLPI